MSSPLLSFANVSFKDRLSYDARRKTPSSEMLSRLTKMTPSAENRGLFPLDHYAFEKVPGNSFALQAQGKLWNGV